MKGNAQKVEDDAKHGVKQGLNHPKKFPFHNPHLLVV